MMVLTKSFLKFLYFLTAVILCFMFYYMLDKNKLKFNNDCLKSQSKIFKYFMKFTLIKFLYISIKCKNIKDTIIGVFYIFFTLHLIYRLLTL